MATMQNEELLENCPICEEHDTAEAIKNAEEAEKDNCERARTVLCTEDIITVLAELVRNAKSFAEWDEYTKRSVAVRQLYVSTILSAITDVADLSALGTGKKFHEQL